MMTALGNQLMVAAVGKTYVIILLVASSFIESFFSEGHWIVWLEDSSWQNVSNHLFLFLFIACFFQWGTPNCFSKNREIAWWLQLSAINWWWQLSAINWWWQLLAKCKWLLLVCSFFIEFFFSFSLALWLMDSLLCLDKFTVFSTDQLWKKLETKQRNHFLYCVYM